MTGRTEDTATEVSDLKAKIRQVTSEHTVFEGRFTMTRQPNGVHVGESQLTVLSSVLLVMNQMLMDENECYMHASQAVYVECVREYVMLHITRQCRLNLLCLIHVCWMFQTTCRRNSAVASKRSMTTWTSCRKN